MKNQKYFFDNFKIHNQLLNFKDFLLNKYFNFLIEFYMKTKVKDISNISDKEISECLDYITFFKFLNLAYLTNDSFIINSPNMAIFKFNIPISMIHKQMEYLIVFVNMLVRNYTDMY